MNQPLAVLDNVEREVAGLLVAGLATRRGGREQLVELAGELSALNMERLAAELRKLSSEEEPRVLAAGALTSIAMARKFRERLLPWPEVDASAAIPFARDSSVRLSSPDISEDQQDVPTLARQIESGNGLVRARAAELLVRAGELAIPDLSKLATRGSVTVRREAIAALGRIGGEAALESLAGQSLDPSCFRALYQAIVPHGQAAVPGLTAALTTGGAEKTRQPRQLTAAALLYRMGLYEPLAALRADRQTSPLLLGLAIAARARARGGWDEPPAMVDGLLWDRLFLAAATVAWAKAEAIASLDTLTQLLDDGPVDEVRNAARWMGCGSHLESSLAEHCLGQLSSARSKDRDRAASVLRGLADPSLVPRLEGLMVSGQVAPALVARVLGETGGAHAVGLLLDMARRWGAEEDALKALKQLGDPGSAPGLLELLLASPESSSAELTLVSLGDGAVDWLAGEMADNEGSPLASRIEQILLQIDTRRAREALKGTGASGTEALLDRLGHPRLGEGAARALARQGEATLDALEEVLSSSGNLTARLNSMKALADIEGPRAEEILLRALDRAVAGSGVSAEAAVAYQGIRLLTRKPDERVVPLLVRGVATGVYQVQEAAVQAIIKAGPAVGPRLMPLLDDSKPMVRARAIEALGKLEFTEAEEKGIALLADPEAPVRMSAAVALGSFGAITRNPAAADALGGLLRGDVWPPPILEAIIKIGHPCAISHLRRYAHECRQKPNVGEYFARQTEQTIKKLESAPKPPSRPRADKGAPTSARLSPGAPGDVDPPTASTPGAGLVGKLRRLLGGK